MQPSSYLRPRGLSRPMTPAQPERAVDRDERLALVSIFVIFFIVPVSILVYPASSLGLVFPRFLGLMGVRAIRTLMCVPGKSESSTCEGG